MGPRKLDDLSKARKKNKSDCHRLSWGLLSILALFQAQVTPALPSVMKISFLSIMEALGLGVQGGRGKDIQAWSTQAQQHRAPRSLP
jgi:hypothetical protein